MFHVIKDIVSILWNGSVKAQDSMTDIAGKSGGGESPEQRAGLFKS